MKLLAVETSTSACCVALSAGDDLLAETMVHLERGLSSELLAVIDGVLARGGVTMEELDGFGVGVGPGSFTSVRIGIATVTGLAIATGKPVARFTSLEMLALDAPYCRYPVCAVIDARKQEVYAGLYDVTDHPVEISAPRVAAPADIAAVLSGPVLLVGDGAGKYRSLFAERLGPDAHFPDVFHHRPRPANAVLLTRRAFSGGILSDASTVEPLYLRPSDAEIAREKKLSV